VSKRNQKFLAGVLATAACILLVVFVQKAPVIGQSVLPSGPQITVADNLVLTRALKVGAIGLGYDGTTADMLRIANVFKSVDVSAKSSATTAPWTPASGKKFRLMGGLLSAEDAETLTLVQGSSETTVFKIDVLDEAPIYFDLGQGILGSTADGTLSINSGSGTTVVGVLFGMEE